MADQPTKRGRVTGRIIRFIDTYGWSGDSQVRCEIGGSETDPEYTVFVPPNHPLAMDWEQGDIYFGETYMVITRRVQSVRRDNRVEVRLDLEGVFDATLEAHVYCGLENSFANFQVGDGVDC